MDVAEKIILHHAVKTAMDKHASKTLLGKLLGLRPVKPPNTQDIYQRYLSLADQAGRANPSHSLSVPSWVMNRRLGESLGQQVPDLPVRNWKQRFLQRHAGELQPSVEALSGGYA